MKKEIPEATGWDHAHLAVKAALSAVPIAGGPAAELFAAVIAPPLARRRDAWLQGLADGLAALEEKVDGFDPQTLVDNEAFISAAMEASQIALRTHQKEKLEALRNAVLNVAVGDRVDEEEQATFLGLIQEFTTWHLAILKTFQNPSGLAREKNLNMNAVGGPSAVLESVVPALRGRRDEYDPYVTDLHQRGLLGIDSLHVMMTSQGMYAKRTTARGDRFLAFIASPLKE